MIAVGRVQHFGICIIGAGPAGSALATRLVQLGHSVCVIERAQFPRPRIGELLSPGVWPQLDLLGLRTAVAAGGFRPCPTSLVQWETDIPVRRHFGTAGLLVDRGRFDALLLDHARANGARVMQPAVLRSRARHEEGWHLNVELSDRVHTLNVDFLADASGRSAVLRGRKERTGPRTLALYGYWRGVSPPQEPRIQAASDAWYWGVPLPDGTYNAMVFLDTTDFRAQRASCLSATYKELIGRSALKAAVRDARLVGPVHAADATPYLDGEKIGPRSIKIGESALALDPLSSSGVQKAINTALTGAVVVNTLLRCPERAHAATQFYTNNITETSDQHRRWAAAHYGIAAATRPERFWQVRSGEAAGRKRIAPSIDFDPVLPGDLVVTLSPEAMLLQEPCIVGDLVVVKPALRHPSLDRPVAYLGGQEVAPLLNGLRGAVSVSVLMNSWHIPTELKPAIARWLLQNRVLIPSSKERQREYPQ